MSFSFTSLLFALDTCQALRNEEQKEKETDKFPHFFFLSDCVPQWLESLRGPLPISSDRGHGE